MCLINQDYIFAKGGKNLAATPKSQASNDRMKRTSRQSSLVLCQCCRSRMMTRRVYRSKRIYVKSNADFTPLPFAKSSLHMPVKDFLSLKNNHSFNPHFSQSVIIFCDHSIDIFHYAV